MLLLLLDIELNLLMLLCFINGRQMSLKKKTKLLDAGIITQEEFEKKKKVTFIKFLFLEILLFYL